MQWTDILIENKKRVLEHSGRPAASGESFAESFPLWAEKCVRIKPKGGGAPVPFVLNRAQRRLVAALEEMRLAGEPIRLVLLKARQWGGSTCIQIYMAWLQIIHSRGLNSLIIAHQISGSEEIRDMYQRMVDNYADGEGVEGEDDEEEGARVLTLKRVGRSGAAYRLVERDCKITVGSAERPDSSRGGDYNLVHLSEVGLWKRTKGKKPEDIVRSATSGVLLREMTMIVLESTANGAGTFFHREYLAAKEGQSQFRALFIPWFEIEAYQLPLRDPEEFARNLFNNRHDTTATGRAQSGSYLWSLWQRGATLEAINWYISERRKYSDHNAMAAEYPSDDLEAFSHSGDRVFAPEAVDRLRAGTRPPSEVGELEEEGFTADSLGALEVWERPDAKGAGAAAFRNRYLVVVDVGGRSAASDWSVIAVFDRRGEAPEIVAQWRGHTDHDLLAAKAARIAGWYHDALLVIESNTLETHDADRDVDGLQAPYLLRELEDRYPNLYFRESAGGYPRPGFHTNTSTKPMVVGTLVKWVRNCAYCERDSKAIEELLQYERRPNGSFAACAGCHDDILMTRAIGLYIHEYCMEPCFLSVAPKSPGSRYFDGPGSPGASGSPLPSQDSFGVF